MTTIIQEEKEHGERNGKNAEVIDMGMIILASSDVATKKGGVTREYIRSNYEDISAMDKYKEKAFQGKQSMDDPYAAGKLHRKNQAAINKYGKKQASAHQSHVDHKVPIKKIHKKIKNMRYLTDTDVKIAVNRKVNYKVVSGRLNMSKGEKSNLEYVCKHPELKAKHKIAIVAEGAIAETAVFTELAAKNMTKAALEGAGDIVGFTVAINLGEFVMGKKGFYEATVDTISGSIEGVVVNATTKVSNEVMSFTYNAAKDAIIKEFGEESAKKIVGEATEKSLDIVGNNFAEVFIFAMQVSDALNRYTQNEITERELLDEVGQKTFILITMKVGGALGEIAGSSGGIIGQIIGKTVGKAVGYIVGTVVICSIKNFSANDKEIKAEFDRMNSMTNQAIGMLKQIEVEFAEHKALLNYWGEEIEAAYIGMENAIAVNDEIAFANSLNIIAKEFNYTSPFSNVAEFNYMFDDQESIFQLRGGRKK